MNDINYRKLDQVDRADLAYLLNKERVRKHLAVHPVFDAASLDKWLQHKRDMDALPGSRLRVVYIGKRLAGWCGIQPLDRNHEVAIVLDDAHWGRGGEILQELMSWAYELGHESVSLCFPLSRREYVFLRQRSQRTYRRELMGEVFRVYELEVARDWALREGERYAQQ